MLQIEIQQNFYTNPLQQYLEDIELRTDFININLNFKKLHPQHLDLFNELGDELDLTWDKLLKKEVIFNFKILNLQPTDYHIFFDSDHHFNRYRLKTLRNSFYHDTPFFDLQKWRTYCRSKEKEAFKGGLVKEIWAPTAAEKLFGESDDPGYFGGNGSNGWKLQAVAHFCLDLYMKNQGLKFIRLSPYDSFMANGKIELIGPALKMRKERISIQKMLARKVGYKIPSNKEEINED